MKVVSFNNIVGHERLVEQIAHQDWSAAHFLADLLRGGNLVPTLGQWAQVLCLTDGDNELVAFATLSEQDCIADKALTPWIGFLFTVPCGRNRGFARKLVQFACDLAKQKGYDAVYLATDHTNLYEKMGFTYLETRTDVWNESARIYIKKLD